MSELTNRLSELRRKRGWSQQELADRSGVSRAEVSAIETGRLVPSTSTALELALVLGTSVETLFSLRGRSEAEPTWAFPPAGAGQRFWEAGVGGRRLLYPVELTAMGVIPQDGSVRGDGSLERHSESDAEGTLVVAGCDPAVGLLASELRRVEGLRVLPLTRSSREALSLLERGLVHAAGLHWSGESGEDANASVVASSLGPRSPGFRLLHLARWQEGVALASSLRLRSPRALSRAKIRWVAREEGSGARRCLDRLLGSRRRPGAFRHLASDHRGVALAVRDGWAQAGVAVRLAAEEVGLDFIALEQEDYELCFAGRLRSDRSVEALRRTLESGALRRLYRELPGYDVRRMGEERGVA